MLEFTVLIILLRIWSYLKLTFFPTFQKASSDACSVLESSAFQTCLALKHAPLEAYWKPRKSCDISWTLLEKKNITKSTLKINMFPKCHRKVFERCHMTFIFQKLLISQQAGYLLNFNNLSPLICNCCFYFLTP